VTKLIACFEIIFIFTDEKDSFFAPKKSSGIKFHDNDPKTRKTLFDISK